MRPIDSGALDFVPSVAKVADLVLTSSRESMTSRQAQPQRRARSLVLCTCAEDSAAVISIALDIWPLLGLSGRTGKTDQAMAQPSLSDGGRLGEGRAPA